MRFLDQKGRLLGWLNVIDLLAVLLVCALGAWSYAWLNRPHNIAQPYALETTIAWAEVVLRLPPHEAWLADHLIPGARQYDERSGQPVAELLNWTSAPDGSLLAQVRVQAVADARNRLIYDNALLIPGRLLRIETEAFLLEARISSVKREQSPDSNKPDGM